VTTTVHASSGLQEYKQCFSDSFIQQATQLSRISLDFREENLISDFISGERLIVDFRFSLKFCTS
jgi:hypothetical protein